MEFLKAMGFDKLQRRL